MDAVHACKGSCPAFLSFGCDMTGRLQRSRRVRGFLRVRRVRGWVWVRGGAVYPLPTVPQKSEKRRKFLLFLVSPPSPTTLLSTTLPKKSVSYLQHACVRAIRGRTSKEVPRPYIPRKSALPPDFPESSSSRLEGPLGLLEAPGGFGVPRTCISEDARSLPSPTTSPVM